MQFYVDGINQPVFQLDAYPMSLFSFTQKNSKICFILNCLLVIIYSTLSLLLLLLLLLLLIFFL